jgi:hypothetical protein
MRGVQGGAGIIPLAVTAFLEILYWSYILFEENGASGRPGDFRD